MSNCSPKEGELMVIHPVLTRAVVADIVGS